MLEKPHQITTLQHLLDYDVYKFIAAEKQLQKSLPDWINHAGSLKLKTVLHKYLHFVDNHLENLKQYFKKNTESKLIVEDEVMHSFINNTNEKLSMCTDSEIKDACLLASIQYINHYKISAFGTAAAFANTLGTLEQATIFHEAEVTEKQIDDRLSQLTEYEINLKARTPIGLHA
jgi:ferritin-like metal-binding protein YciE